MIHKNCGGTIEYDCSSMYSIRSAGLKITSRGLVPGVIQIDSSNSKIPAKLICSHCKERLSTKEDYQNEIVDKCVFCQTTHSTEELKVVDNLGMVCIDCVNNINLGKLDAKNKVLLYYGDVIKGKEFPTLLTILMKK